MSGMHAKTLFKCAAMTAVLSLALATGAAALARKDKTEEILAKYEKTGEMTTCINTRIARDIDVLDDYSLLVLSGGEYYLNEFSGRCSGLGRERRYVHESSNGQMCRGDIIRVIDMTGRPGGSCSLGSFEKLGELEPEE